MAEETAKPTVYLPTKFIKSKMAVKNGEVKVLFTCAQDASHAMVDLTSRYINGNSATGDVATVNLYLVDKVVEESIPALTNSLYRNLQIDNEFIYPELNKIIVGAGQSLVAEVVSGDSVNFRVTGDEYPVGFIGKAGHLNGVVTKDAALYEVFRLDDPLASDATVTISVHNPDSVDSMTEVFISETAQPLPVDNIMLANVTPGNTGLMENTRIGVGERILVKSQSKNLIFTVNGVVISSVIGTCKKD